MKDGAAPGDDGGMTGGHDDVKELLLQIAEKC
jgi:hypothetical protein